MHRRRLVTRTVAITLAIALGLAAGTDVSVAGGTVDAWIEDDHVGAAATSGGSVYAHVPTGIVASSCAWTRLTPEHADIADDMARAGIGAERGTEPGAWYRRTCDHPDGTTRPSVHWVVDRVDPAALAEQAADRVPIPAPGLGINPSPESGAVVFVDTWLWVDPAAWRPVSAQAAAGGLTVTATASPRRVVWDMGNGDQITCDGPGTPYDPSRSAAEQSTDCSYTYRHSSARAEGGAYTVTATVVWQVTWAVAGGAGGGDLGAASRSQSVRVPVKEIQAVNR